MTPLRLWCNSYAILLQLHYNSAANPLQLCCNSVATLFQLHCNSAAAHCSWASSIWLLCSLCATLHFFVQPNPGLCSFYVYFYFHSFNRFDTSKSLEIIAYILTYKMHSQKRSRKNKIRKTIGPSTARKGVRLYNVLHRLQSNYNGAQHSCSLIILTCINLINQKMWVALILGLRYQAGCVEPVCSSTKKSPNLADAFTVVSRRRVIFCGWPWWRHAFRRGNISLGLKQLLD